jgi:hypothetical protein
VMSDEGNLEPGAKIVSGLGRNNSVPDFIQFQLNY